MSHSSAMEYTVTWVIEITAESPKKAAQEAREIQLDPDSEAVFFTVIDATGKTTDVDLDE